MIRMRMGLRLLAAFSLLGLAVAQSDAPTVHVITVGKVGSLHPPPFFERWG